MMFLNAQKPNLLKDPYIFGADSLIFDLEDAVALPEKDAARFTLFHTLKKGNFRGAEKVVRINGIDTPFWKEDIRAAVLRAVTVSVFQRPNPEKISCSSKKKSEKRRKKPP